MRAAFIEALECWYQLHNLIVAIDIGPDKTSATVLHRSQARAPLALSAPVEGLLHVFVGAPDPTFWTRAAMQAAIAEGAA